MGMIQLNISDEGCSIPGGVSCCHCAKLVKNRPSETAWGR